MNLAYTNIQMLNLLTIRNTLKH